MVRLNNDLRDPKCDLWWFGEGTKREYLGVITNHLQFNDVRIQIKKEQSDRYRIYFKGDLLSISKDGRMENWPEGLYDQGMKQLIELFKS